MRQVKNLQRTVIEVGARDLWLWFEESIRTARRLPAVKPKGYKAAWVDIPTDWHSYGWERAKIKHRSTLAKYLRDDLYRMTLVLNTDKKIRQKLQFCI